MMRIVVQSRTMGSKLVESFVFSKREELDLDYMVKMSLRLNKEYSR